MSEAVEQNNAPRDWHHCACRFDVDDNQTWTCSLHERLQSALDTYKREDAMKSDLNGRLQRQVGVVILENFALKNDLAVLRESLRWRDVREEFPKDGERIVIASAEQVQALRFAEVPFFFGPTHWLPIPPIAGEKT